MGCNTHMLVTTLAISLYSYLYLKVAKCCFFHNSYVFFSTKSVTQRAEQVLHGSGGGERWGQGGERWGQGGQDNICTYK
jgi:hypothetical protein